MRSNPFIDRPVLASVISIIIVLAGLVAMRFLAVAHYPDIVPPQVVVLANYPGASAQTLAETVSAPLETQINGVEDMLYMESSTSDSGQLRVTVTFKIGTDPDKATIDVNNRVQRALPLLPQEVARQGVLVNKQSTTVLQIVTLSAAEGNYDPIFISNYALMNVLDELKRTQGVGEASLFMASDYSMRIWLRPDKLAEYDLTPGDVASAVREQNAQFAAGRFGEAPVRNALAFTYSVSTEGRLPDVASFEDIILRTDANASSLRLRDVARVELGAQDYSFSSTYNGKPAVAIGINLQPGANALDTASAVRAKMKEASLRFPKGLRYAIPYDTTLFVRVSINEVIKTFFEAMVLVILVVFLFLQNLRATLIPVIAVPVSILGTFAGMYALGFSVNLLTLFGLVLAIGIVVDDAIIVLENVERLMVSEHLTPRDATVKAMREVTGPIIAIVLVLCAVFIPVAFMGGLVGEMYKQFAITIAISVAISGLVALTLTPALCARLLRSGHQEPAAPFRAFNRFFERMTARYTSGVRFILRHTFLGVMLFLAMLAVSAHLLLRIPGSLMPDEDQGWLAAMANLPPAAALERSERVMAQVTARLLADPNISDVISFSGFDLMTGSRKTSRGASFIQLKDWNERTEASQDSRVLPGALVGKMEDILDAEVQVFNPPPIDGLSTTGGFEFFVQDRASGGMEALMQATQGLIDAAARRPELMDVQTTFSASVPRYRLEVQREKAKALGVPISSIFETMQATFGNAYVNDFTLSGRSFRVSMQAEANFRERPEDLKHVFVRSSSGGLLPLESLLRIHRDIGPDMLDRFNGFPSIKVMGGPAPGYSSGQALLAMTELAREHLPDGYAMAWTGSAYQEQAVSGTGAQALLFGILMVFLILAAQYERWSLPLAVILTIPFALFGALVAIWLRGLNNDLYFQIGLVTLSGLAAKNAILIVEFAMMKRQQGMSAMEAAVEGARLRFRPIIMTSLAFILGCVPLAVSTGAGSASRHSIGTGVIGGMLAATFLAVFFIPLFFRLVARRETARSEAAAPAVPDVPPMHS
ncbi:MAG: efflux RND transporter permease subunit [Cystobacter sp.]